MSKVSFKILTLGCKLNFAESGTIARALTSLGFAQADANDAADICIINTCAVTQVAEKKCRQAIQKAATENPAAIIVLTGCYAALQKDLPLNNPNIIIASGKQEAVNEIARRFAIPHLQGNSNEDFFTAYSLSGRTRSFLKVQDGCDYHCAYCTVASARGYSRNVSIADVAAQAQIIAKAGVKEIILTGINIGDFGKSTNESLLQLIKALEKTSIERYRISSIEPNLLTKDIIDFTAQSQKFMPHFHIPLQAACNRILQLMGRRYTTDLFADKVRYILNKIPAAFIGIDVIAGLPTETNDDFEQGAVFLKTLGAAYLHVFPYSLRPNTPAATMLQTPQHQIAQRTRYLNGLCSQIHKNFYRQHLGSTDLVLFESTQKNGKMTGFTRNYIRVEIPYAEHHINCIAEVKLCRILPNGNVEGNIICK
jgi:threonylcarbamoyladenosine tRNA methylthiotransferase MtaB